jgi:thiol-disulfide isomerase/thioredoxin
MINEGSPTGGLGVKDHNLSEWTTSTRRTLGQIKWLQRILWAALVGVICLLVWQVQHAVALQSMRLTGSMKQDKVMKAPELEGTDWLNTAGPLKIEDLRGKVVLLDFWTFCCINCIHILPDLEALEKKYPNELVVIGVHSAKFNAEKETRNIREAVLRYNIQHPVVNDANHNIWNHYGVTAWPTFWLIDPEGNLVGYTQSEGQLPLLDSVIATQIEKHRQKGTLNSKPIRVSLERDKLKMTGPQSPLLYPGKVRVDLAGKRLFIADSSNHRIVITDLNGRKLDVAGRGTSGNVEGKFEEAEFNDPQGMALRGDLLYVADRKNHLIKALNLKERTVATVAGTGKQGRDRNLGGPPREVGLNSPWDLLLVGDQLFIAMAGHHEIWAWDLKRNDLHPYAGNGAEDIVDGSLRSSSFAQPSGLTTDGTDLFVADSEVSAIRAVPLNHQKDVRTIVGTGLFNFGDKDGTGDSVRLQHALGVALWQNHVLVADTYNNKIKMIDPKTRQALTFLGDGTAGREDQPPRFNEPAGIDVADDKAYVADTNNHLIRVIDLKKRTMTTLKLDGVPYPAPPPTKPSFRNLISIALPEAVLPTMGDLQLVFKLNLPPGLKVDQASPIGYLVEAQSADKKTVYESFGELFGTTTLKLPATKLKSAGKLKVSVEYYPCSVGQGLCQVKSQSWEMSVKQDDKGASTLVLETRQ